MGIMDLIEFQRMSLVHTLHVVACDGDFDPREVDEIRRMTTATPYFSELDPERELAEALEALRTGGAALIDRTLGDLSARAVPQKQMLKLLEVLLHAVHADDLVHESERLYLQRVREALRISVAEVAAHFPNRFALFVPGAGSSFQGPPDFQMPVSLPDASQFLAPN
jgi:uncharacterized tellurite resistance protein B-like protein